MALECIKYSEYSFAVYGNTIPVKADFNEIKKSDGSCGYNYELKNEPGWCFSNKSKEKVENVIKKYNSSISIAVPIAVIKTDIVPIISSGLFSKQIITLCIDELNKEINVYKKEQIWRAQYNEYDEMIIFYEQCITQCSIELAEMEKKFSDLYRIA